MVNVDALIRYYSEDVDDITKAERYKRLMFDNELVVYYNTRLSGWGYMLRVSGGGFACNHMCKLKTKEDAIREGSSHTSHPINVHEVEIKT